MGTSNSSEQKESFILSYTNGDKYEGEVINGVRNGYGTYFYHNGDKFEGFWKDNKKHGMGTLYYKDGNLYVGQWRNSEKDGIGTLYLRNGEKYHGEFKNGRKHGKGFLVSQDGNKYFGYFKENKKHKLGVIYYNKGKIGKEEWENGVLKNSKLIKDNNSDGIITESSLNFLRHEGSPIIPNFFDDKAKSTNKNDYVDSSFENYIEDQIKFHLSQSSLNNKINSKFFTLEVAKYFKARIPNNYFDAMQILIMTSDLIYDNPHITDWSEEEVCTWMMRLGVEEHRELIVNNHLNGFKFIKLNVSELQNLGIKKVKEVKLIMKSIDFLRIFLKLKIDYQDYLYEKHKEKNENLQNNAINIHFHHSLTHIHVNSLSLNREKGGEREKEKDSVQSHLGHGRTVTMTNTLSHNHHDFKQSLEKSHDLTQVNQVHKEKDDSINEEFIENQEYVLTKMSISNTIKLYLHLQIAKLLLHSLNLTGFNFFIDFKELKFVQKIGEGGEIHLYII